MAVTRVSRTKDGRAAIRYALEEKSHKEGMERVLASSGSNLDADPKFAMMQMKAVWDSAGKNDGKSVQVYRLIQSFGLDELDPENPEAIEKANLIGLELAKELYPDRQALVVTQADGEGGMLHNHIVVNSVSAIDGKSLRGKETTSWERVSSVSDKIIERHGLKPLVSKKAWDNRTIAEMKMASNGEYVGKDDLKSRLLQGLDDMSVTNKDVFKQRMADDYQVTVSYGNKGESVSYSFVDENGKKKAARGTKRGLGEKFNVENLETLFARNIETGKQMREEKRLQQQAEEKAAIMAQPDVLDVKPIGDFGFNLDAELSALRPKRKSVKVSKIVEPDMAREVREEREARQAAVAAAEEMDKLHVEALAENKAVDAGKAAEAASVALEEAERKAKQEKVLKEAEAMRQRIVDQEAAQRKEAAEKLQKSRADAMKRLRESHAVLSGGSLPVDVIDRFIVNAEKLTGTMRKVPGGEMLHDDSSILFKTKSDMFEEKRAKREVVQQHTHDLER